MFIGEIPIGSEFTLVLKDYEGEEIKYKCETLKRFPKSKIFCKALVIEPNEELYNQLNNAKRVDISIELGHGIYTWNEAEIEKIKDSFVVFSTIYEAEYVDRRLSPRIPINVKGVIVKVDDEEITSVPVKIKDISASGIGFILHDVEFNVDDLVKINFKDDTLPLNVMCYARVVRSRDLKSNDTEYGAVIVDSTPNADDYLRVKSQEMCLGLYCKRK